MPLHWRGFFLSRFLAAPSKTIAIFAGFFARGKALPSAKRIVAEPPKPPEAANKGHFARGIEAEPLAQREAQASDGADSPTQANEVSAAARPNSNEE